LPRSDRGQLECEEIGEAVSKCLFYMGIMWTLCSACNPTFYWPVECSPCSCRVCLWEMYLDQWFPKWGKLTPGGNMRSFGV